jgi:hypothetical protein
MSEVEKTMNLNVLQVGKNEQIKYTTFGRDYQPDDKWGIRSIVPKQGVFIAFSTRQDP